MSREDVIRVDDRTLAAWSAHDVDGVLEMLADEFVWSDVGVPEPMRTTEDARRYVTGWFTAFPDMRLKQLNRVVSDDSIAGELEFTGTNSGPLVTAMGEIPATGRSIIGHGAYFARLDGDRVVEFSAYPDLAGMMAQLGLMPQ